MKQMQIYVAVSLTYSRDEKLTRHICQFLTNIGAKVMSPWVAQEEPKQGLTPEEVFERDFGALAKSDAVVAEVSLPSTGVGMELMAALKAKLPIACLHKKGDTVSFLVRGALGIKPIQYSPGCIDEGLKEAVEYLQLRARTQIPKNINYAQIKEML